MFAFPIYVRDKVGSERRAERSAEDGTCETYSEGASAPVAPNRCETPLWVFLVREYMHTGIRH